VEKKVGTETQEQLAVLSFNQLLNEFASHDLGHIRQIIEVLPFARV